MLANLVGRAWNAILLFLCIPFYIQILGMEGYGLIGFFFSLQGVIKLLDLGLSTVVNKEIASFSLKEEHFQDLRDLVRTLEIIYWGIGLILTLAILFSSSWIGGSWIQSEYLSPHEVTNAVFLMALAIVFQWPVVFYSGCFSGMQKQVTLNFWNSAIAIFRFGLVIPVLYIVDPTIENFFLWQILVGLVSTVPMAMHAWKSLPGGYRIATFQSKILRKIWRFTVGLSIASILAVILMQSDKILLSKLLMLEQFGYYTLATTVAGLIYYLVYPIGMAVFPKLSQLVSEGELEEVRRMYHLANQVMSAAIIPLSLAMSIGAKEMIFIWTGNESIASNVGPVLSIYCLGTLIHGLLHIPFFLQFASSWTKLALYANLIAVVLFIPLLFWLTNYLGMQGGAYAWLITNLIYSIFVMFAMHKRLLKKDLLRWLFSDLGVSFVISIVVFSAWYVVIPSPSGRVSSFLWYSLLILSSQTLCIMATSEGRSWLQKNFFHRGEMNAM